MERFLARVRANFPTLVILEKERLSRHVTLGIGGQCAALCYPRTRAEFCAISAAAREENRAVMVLGGGSNVLVSDAGTADVVIKTQKMETITFSGNTVTAECGVSLAHLSEVTANRGLGGLEFACGIPGTVGGAVMGNAGAFGQSVSDVVQNVTVLLADGGVRTLDVENCNFAYRKSGICGAVLAVTFALFADDGEAIAARRNAYARQRKERQPTGRSAGSVFLAADGVPAGKLIEETGLKGLRLGGAQVSEKHANFIVNTGGATAREYLALMSAVQNAVFGATGKKLTPEIKWIGEENDSYGRLPYPYRFQPRKGHDT